MKHYLALGLLFLSANVMASKPNILFIYADDMGWTGSSVEMIQGDLATKSDFYQTPNLERLALKGMTFSQAYSPGPMCTPSRAAVLTGISPAELHITTPGGGRSDNSRKLITPMPEKSLPDKLPTIGTVLKEQGYTTALLGKWHIGRQGNAGMYGFDLHDGHTANDAKGTDEDPKEIFSLTQRGIAFMEQSVKAGKPFYLQLSHYAVHSPTQSRPGSVKMFQSLSLGKIHKEADYAGMAWDLDASLALLFESLEKLKIADNTYIVFMSDNGAAGNRRKPNNAPLYAGKGSLYEGGIRVPLIISGPGVKNGYSDVSVSGTDLFSTFANWAGAKVSSNESEDLTPLLMGKGQAFKRRQSLLFHNPHYGRGRLQVPQTALISGNWKLLKDWESGSYRLYDLANDLGESNDLSSQEPKRLQSMMNTLEARLKATGAQLPITNPDYDPSTEPTKRKNR